MGKKGPSCAERQRRMGGPKRPVGDIRNGLHDAGISKGNVHAPHPSQVFSLNTVQHLARMALSHHEISIVDGSNALARGEGGKRFTIIVVGEVHMGRYCHLFGHPLVYFLVVKHPRDEDPAIQEILIRIKSGMHVFLVTGDTKEDPIMNGALNLARRGGRVVVFSRHPNTSTSKQREQYHETLKKEVEIAQKGGSFEVCGVCAVTPKGAPSPRQ